MIIFIKRLLYYADWFFKCKILNKKIPLNSSIILTDKCNLNCKHCVVAHLGYENSTSQEVCRYIDDLFYTGSRMLVITGGEPFLWKDNDFNIEDVVKYAHKKGFFRVIICTNGTFPLNSSADYLWVSLDGFQQNHNDIRGNIYNEVILNIKKTKHKGIYINFTISKINYLDFEKSAEKILNINNVKGILFHLYTNYLGGDQSLVIDAEKRKDILNRILRLKYRYPIKISNTFAGIKALIKDNWERPLWGSVTLNKGEVSACCCRNGIYDEAVCKNCGCSPAAETWVLQKVKISAVIENMKYL